MKKQMSKRRARKAEVPHDFDRLKQKLTTFGDNALQTMSHDAVIHSFMGAAIDLALLRLRYKDLSNWLRRLADSVDSECARTRRRFD